MKTLRILIICTGKPSKRLIQAIENRGHTYEYFEPSELYLVISDEIRKDDRVYFQISKKNKPIILDLKNFNAIITRIGNGGEYAYTVLEHLTKNLGIYSVQNANANRIASHKGWTSQLVSVAGLRSPKTLLFKEPQDIDFMIEQVGPFPIVLKTPRGSQGSGVALMENKQQLTSTLELLHSKNVETLLQQYIEGGGTDYRVIVLNGKVLCTMKRTSADGFKANLSKKGKGELVKLSKEHEEFCIKASKAIDLNFAGVDVMISDKDDKIYLIEINSNPGTKSIEICEHNWFIDWVELLEEKVLGSLSLPSSSRKVVGSLTVENQNPDTDLDPLLSKLSDTAKFSLHRWK
jgi:ribosomal protein S6--L-glutamate ligase